jgi:heme/copper-type cytochrome/quinol oxidase subunit 1
MRFRRILVIALIMVFVLALALFLASRYTPLVLPQGASSDLLLWGAVIAGAVAFLSGIKDVIELVEKAASSEARGQAQE